MKLTPFLTLNLAFFSVSIFANTIVSTCPSLDTIENVNFTYSASNSSGGWIGIATQGNSGDITSFREALVYDLQPLILQKCTYNLENGLVDMYLDENRDKEISILNYQDSWPKLGGGWFDLFECRGKAEDCQFEFED